MNVGKTLFAQVMEFVPWKSFGRIVARHQGDSGIRTLSCADLFRVLAFSQLTWRESLRDIEACLAANQSKLFHFLQKHYRRAILAVRRKSAKISQAKALVIFSRYNPAVLIKSHRWFSVENWVGRSSGSLISRSDVSSCVIGNTDDLSA